MQERHTNRLQYFRELAESTEKYIIPFIEDVMQISPNTKVLEIGCGEGGNLLPFVRKGCNVVGCDLSALRIEQAKEYFATEDQSKITLIASDIFLIKEMYHRFDLILIHDVIEHIEEKEDFLEHVKDFLAPGGKIFIGFPAWQMPFGGHQQTCRSKMASHLPWIHLMPKVMYSAFLKACNETPAKIEEMLQTKRAAMTIEHFYRLTDKLGYKRIKQALYFINPHYETKFGLTPCKLSPMIGAVPVVRNFFTTSCFFVLKLK